MDNKRYILIPAILLCIAAGAGFASSVDTRQTTGVLKEVATNETADWQTYKNDQYGFEIKYPPDFLVSVPATLYGGKALVFEVVFTQKKWPRDISHPSIVVMVLNTDLRAKQWVENNYPTLVSSPGDPPTGRGEISQAEINGYAVLKFEQRAAAGGAQYMVFQKDHLLIELGNLISPNGDDTAVYNQMVSTFQFTGLDQRENGTVR